MSHAYDDAFNFLGSRHDTLSQIMILLVEESQLVPDGGTMNRFQSLCMCMDEVNDLHIFKPCWLKLLFGPVGCWDIRNCS